MHDGKRRTHHGFIEATTTSILARRPSSSPHSCTQHTALQNDFALLLQCFSSKDITKWREIRRRYFFVEITSELVLNLWVEIFVDVRKSRPLSTAHSLHAWLRRRHEDEDDDLEPHIHPPTLRYLALTLITPPVPATVRMLHEISDASYPTAW